MVRLSIVSKLLLLVVFAVFATSLSLGFVTQGQVKRALTESVERGLTGTAASRRDALQDYLHSIEQDLVTLSSSEMIIQALTGFDTAWTELGPDAKSTLQQLYIQENPFPTGEKEKLDAAEDGSAYSAAHSRFHPWLREFLQARGYYDIFLFRNDGELIYTVFKELDYATNLSDGTYAETGLGDAFRAASRLKHGEKAFFDFSPYAPSHGAPASFISTPVFDETGTRIGVLAFQMPVDRINDTLGSRAGLGETGETFLVGADGLMRSDAPRAEGSTILKTQASPLILTDHSTGRQRLYQGENYRSEHVVAAAASLRFLGTDWYVVAEMSTDEIMAPVRETNNSIIMWTLILLFVIGAVSGFIVWRTSRPIRKIAEATQSIADGRMDTIVPFQSRTDEIGPLARSIDLFRVEMIKSASIAEQQKRDTERQREEAEVRARRGDALTRRVHAFDEIVTRSLTSFIGAADHLDESASALSSIAEETASQSQGIAHASQMASSNVQNVAAATEELSVSVGEISAKMRTTRTATEKAVEKAEMMRERVTSLETAATAISAVIKLITDIAGQTNLLALNATIEAARAGEAGKGFAVVASEVKGLATQTSRATEDISRQIQTIQETTASSVSGIYEILQVISELDMTASEVAASVEQQNSATLQISSSIQEAAGSVSEVDSNIFGVSTASQEAGKTASEMRTASLELKRQSSVLKAEVEAFLRDVRAA